jgi:signal-transduction protein with cAMP-binding, CBS, and nucleotidyltransferase domain
LLPCADDARLLVFPLEVRRGSVTLRPALQRSHFDGGERMKPVSELLNKRDGTLWHVRPEDSVFTALELLAQGGVGALVVMDGARLVGVVSERDYTRKVALQGRNSRETPVSEIMSAQVLTVTPRTGTRTCMQLMSERKIRHLPVVDQGTVLGMLSIRDILDDIIATHEATIAQLESYIQS